MTYGSNNTPKTVSFAQVVDNHAEVAKAQVTKALRAEAEAMSELDNANYRLVKATQLLQKAEITYRESVTKSVWNKDEIRKSYNEAIARFRDADKKVADATEELTKAQKTVASLRSIINGEVVKREFTPEKREALAEKGHAMPDGSYPIENANDLKNAIQSIGRAKDYDATKKHIIEQAKRLSLMDNLPENWKSPTATMKSVADFFKGSDSKPKCEMCKGEGTIRGGNVTCPECKGKEVVAKDADETLATVMRHDKDHDDWHRSHGDEPCTSEKDCATKRAKYDEVKAEVTKGDLRGHEFHGNQYTAGGGESGQHPAHRAWELAQRAAKSNYSKDISNTYQAHREASAWHMKQSQNPNLSEEAVKSHQQAAKAHDIASNAWSKIVGYPRTDEQIGDALRKSQIAANRSGSAAFASPINTPNWGDPTGSITKATALLVVCPACQGGNAMSNCEYCDGEGRVPADGEQDDSMMSDDSSDDSSSSSGSSMAKALFGRKGKKDEEDDSSEDSSEDASGFTAKSLLTRDFQKSEGYKAYIAKGDIQGHEFHGNQYTEGQGGG